MPCVSLVYEKYVDICTSLYGYSLNYDLVELLCVDYLY